MALERRSQHKGRPRANERISGEPDDDIDHQGVIGELALRRFLSIDDDDPENPWVADGPDPGWDVVWRGLKIDVKTSKGDRAKNLLIADYKRLVADAYVPVVLGKYFSWKPRPPPDHVWPPDAQIMGCISRHRFEQTCKIRTFNRDRGARRVITSKYVPYDELADIWRLWEYWP